MTTTSATPPPTGSDTEYTYGPTNISDNNVAASSIGILEFEPYGPSSIVGNDVPHSQEFGISVEYADEEGGVQIQANNASGAVGASLFYYDGTLPSIIVGNDFSNSGLVSVNNSDLLSLVGNNFLNVGKIDINSDTLNGFYHNDLNTSAFNGSSSSMETGAGNLWNAPYPVGGNYWSGYADRTCSPAPPRTCRGATGSGTPPSPCPGPERGSSMSIRSPTRGRRPPRC